MERGLLGVAVGRDTLFHRENRGEIRPHPGPLPADRARKKSGTGLEFIGCRQGRLAAAGTPCMAGGVAGRDGTRALSPVRTHFVRRDDKPTETFTKKTKALNRR
jgi:hypothetical protein